jgi:hypothetical protein
MKHLRTVVTVAVVMLAMTLPRVAAQYREERLDNFLDRHPHMKADLSSSPDLIFDKQYRRSHPELQKFMQDHPNVEAKLRKRGEGPQDLNPEAEHHEAKKTEYQETEKREHKEAKKTEGQEAKQHGQTVTTTEQKQAITATERETAKRSDTTD